MHLFEYNVIPLLNGPVHRIFREVDEGATKLIPINEKNKQKVQKQYEDKSIYVHLFQTEEKACN